MSQTRNKNLAQVDTEAEAEGFKESFDNGCAKAKEVISTAYDYTKQGLNAVYDAGCTVGFDVYTGGKTVGNTGGSAIKQVSTDGFETLDHCTNEVGAGGKAFTDYSIKTVEDFVKWAKDGGNKITGDIYDAAAYVAKGGASFIGGSADGALSGFHYGRHMAEEAKPGSYGNCPQEEEDKATGEPGWGA